MARSADVSSTEAIKRFCAAMHQFEEDARDALTELALEVRRAEDWLQVDRAGYWPRQVHLASNQVSEAQANLERREIIMDQPGACYEERLALQNAKQRMRLAEEKVRLVRHWIIKTKREMDELVTRMARLNDLLDTQLPRGIAALGRMGAALDRYTQTGETLVPQDSGDPPNPSDTAGSEAS